MITRRMKVTIAGESFIATVKAAPLEFTEFTASSDIEMVFKPEDAERLQAASARWHEERSGITFGNLEEEA